MLTDDYTIRLRPFGEEFPCSDTETVIEAMERAGHDIPFGCRGGHCGACKSRTVEGEVETTEEASEFVLTPQEREDGLILLCCALPVTDTVEIEPLFFKNTGAGRGREIIAEVAAVRALSDDTRLISLALVLPEHVDFLPGQYVEVQVPGTEAHRPYSIASPPGRGTVDLLVKLVPGGLFSTYVAERLRPGSELRMTGPYGSCVLRDSDRHLLLIGRGSGLSPLLSMLAHLAAEGSRRPVTLLVGGTTEADLFCADEIGRLCATLPNLKVVTSLSRPGPGWDGLRGRITDHIGRLTFDPEAVEAHTCGPEAMVDDAVAALKAAGVAAADIAYEPFTYQHARAGSAA